MLDCTKNEVNETTFLCNVECVSILQILISHSRISHQRCSVRIGVLRNFTKFTGKHLCQSIFLNKVAGLRPVTLSKKRLWHRCFPVNFAKFLRAPFLQNTFGRLLRSFIQIVYSIWTLNLTETWCTHEKQNHDNIRILTVQVHHVDNILY